MPLQRPPALPAPPGSAGATATGAATTALAPLSTGGGSSSSSTALTKSRTPAIERASSEKALRKTFVEKQCKADVSEEWKKVDDRKIAKLRGILAALQEENQSTQLLKRVSEDAEAKGALDATRASVGERLACCKDKEALFVKKQAELRRHVLENEKALQELETNIEKGEKKSKDEQSECRRLDAEIRTLEKELDDQEVAKGLEQKKIAQTSRYKRFLEEVAQECEGDFDGDVEVLMNRHNTLQTENQNLHEVNEALTSRLDRVREECLRVQSELQNEHLVINSTLHECQMNLDRHRTESQEVEQRLNRALEEKELKESQVGVFQMAIEQLFTRTWQSCKLKQRKRAMLDSVDIKFAPVRGDKADAKLEEMLKQIIERMEDLKEMLDESKETLGDGNAQVAAVVEEGDILDKIKFVQTRDERQAKQSDNSGENSANLASGASALRKPGGGDPGALAAGGTGGLTAGGTGGVPQGRGDTFLTDT